MYPFHSAGPKTSEMEVMALRWSRIFRAPAQSLRWLRGTCGAGGVLRSTGGVLRSTGGVPRSTGGVPRSTGGESQGTGAGAE